MPSALETHSLGIILLYCLYKMHKQCKIRNSEQKKMKFDSISHFGIVSTLVFDNNIQKGDVTFVKGCSKSFPVFIMSSEVFDRNRPVLNTFQTLVTF